ncbi:MAG: response regulator [Sulfurimonas sp.]|uniref:response regulator n=1 Tax=Sulfurimonas sp. TaxID=2022749 RepID=UPI0026298C43|nr:response regulator [Sulfurimonas sp.]MDD5400687.1 response regulator [Sulfurimonas sp.]
MSTQQKNIVIIDDENDILQMLEKYLSRDGGYRITTYSNPVNAISSLPKDTDLILLDIMMPQMNGLDALPKLLEKNPKTKVLMMTAYSTLDKVLNAHRYGATDYIMKPFSSLDALGKKIKEVLKK